MYQKNIFIKLLAVIFLIFSLPCSFAKEISRELNYDGLFSEKNWKIVADGVEIKEIALHRPDWYGIGLRKEDVEKETGFIDRVQKVNIKILRIDPKNTVLRLVYCHDYGEKMGADIRDLVKKSGAIGAVTGGYYDYEKDKKSLKPVGILTADGREISKWLAGINGVFLVKKDRTAEIIYKENYKKSPDILQAVQAGPVLVKDGEIRIDKPSVFNEFKLLPRTAIGLTKEKKILMLASETGFNGLSLYELAEVMKRLGCNDSLNLDGGPSAQMFFGNKNIELYVKGAGKIINAIGIFQR
ncbi:MAG: hypothetical protein A3C43_12260 [Candidatus Schekmanbacteria bacterium RIFCSPHIGHO2_02_FULL_38_11]|uniref:Phosphodiester glycosidase domain-containing protein n=1 Tax=Candidatus Schekmanbacteria bacterium RIFCSPLOWO2_12_FULL_38_15 TaxID=1817883 RepID=A0A1F7SHX2_9BACT|nr:MAG: hypothetical protein A2043_00475 [Candidatus Schekmanbacteria bacterium GWA2_38_9]OGL50881.1 MAG: hypothetical protein A3H37_03465 [Candidatus Schekmanbacteria bacterium RIFCSPLOWO2_02_FULL_38_14]OGL53359.1 MAG: hypothetical protein A3G31_07600 [Candidatus Schekmanbacteria bacterium RIFCSPLOWO2_12_FULL_38_15]OGL55713.1 MAG: hypothetical protein A3C43_12260 [Candidatus Schekmanbacteria bacterium RIFCSPHIGHO2_02_FULL_38_11]